MNGTHGFSPKKVGAEATVQTLEKMYSDWGALAIRAATRQAP
jgi:hypothetical protein